MADNINIRVALITCCKHEEINIKEFIDYYQNLGIDHIFLCDNNEHEYPVKLEDILGEYISSGFVSVENFFGVDNIVHIFYDHVYFREKDNYDWFCVFDADEFLTFHKKYNNIKDYLSDENISKADVIRIPSIQMTSQNMRLHPSPSNELLSTYDIVSDHTKINKNYKNNYIFLKSIIKSSDHIQRISLHNPFFVDDYKPYCIKFNGEVQSTEYAFKNHETLDKSVYGFKIYGQYKEKLFDTYYVCIRHYIYKSCDEYIDKLIRGMAWRSYIYSYQNSIINIDKNIMNYFRWVYNPMVHKLKDCVEIQTYLYNKYLKELTKIYTINRDNFGKLYHDGTKMLSTTIDKIQKLSIDEDNKKDIIDNLENILSSCKQMNLKYSCLTHLYNYIKKTYYRPNE